MARYMLHHGCSCSALILEEVMPRSEDEDRPRWLEILRQTPAGVALLRGPEHRFEWVNPAYERIAGKTSEQLIGRFLTEAIPELQGQEFPQFLDRVYRTGEPFSGHESLIHLTGPEGAQTALYLNFAYLPTRDWGGEIDGIFVHVTDVTEAVEARKLTEESERQFRRLAETIPHLAWMADGQGNRIWFNRRWYEYTGTTFEEAKDWGWQKSQDPSVLPDVLRKWNEVLATGEPFEMVYPLRGADGSFRSFLTRVEPVKDMSGRVVRWFGTNTDITGQRQVEDELRRMNRELEEFAYVASHDLQEPLRMVNIYSQMILRNLDADKAMLEEYAGFVREGVQRMEMLIHDLLTFSRAVHQETASSVADLSAALAQAMAVLRSRIEAAGAVIECGDLPRCLGETPQMVHVFQNILSNSLKYRRADVPLEIRITAEQQGSEVVVCVRDNGIGFDPKYSERIFGLFKRLHKDEYPGTGLGLAICRRIIERSGGRMWAEGQAGAGSSFYFSLPCAILPA
jgi:PAS domain S-box-containing protein